MNLCQLFACILALAFISSATASAQQIGTTYCTSSVNSTGQAAGMSAFGVPEQATGNVILLADLCPANQPGIFFFGPNQASIPFADGTLCISPAGGGITRILPPKVTDATGAATHSLTSAELVVAPGQLTMNYQFWFRDPAAGNTGANLTGAIAITYLPCLNCR